MKSSENTRTLLGYDIDLAQLARLVRERWRLVLGFILGALFLALTYLHLAEYTYTATLVVSPVASSSASTGGLASKLGGLGNIASLAGINIGGNTGTQAFMMYQEGLYSRDVAEQLAKDPQIMHSVFHKQWDAENKKWLPPLPVVRAIFQFGKVILGVPLRPWQPPDGALLQEYIIDHVEVDPDPEKPLVTITYRYKDAQMAVRFLRELDGAVDNKLRSIALVRANQYVGYLSDQLNKVTNTDIRDALMTTLIDQENTVMMASVTAPYAAQPFGPPSASRRPLNPKPLLILPAALLIGGLFGSLAAFWLPPLRGFRGRFRRPSAKPG
jgi:hypothetical protein